MPAALLNKEYYSLLGVAPGASDDELRDAYRKVARENHPDVSTADPSIMRDINEAWRVLSDPQLKISYDASLAEPVPVPQPMPATGRTRRQAWAAGVAEQIQRLAHLSGRSATQTLLMKNPLAQREAYNHVTDTVAKALATDVESRVRAARVAGAAPLDLGVASTLVGIRTLADEIRRNAHSQLSLDVMIKAQLLDRMWDVLAHELPATLTTSLGGNPHIARQLGV